MNARRYRDWAAVVVLLLTLSALFGTATGVTATDTETPENNVSNSTATIAIGIGHTCTLTDGGRALCWGNNRSGELGDGTEEDRSTPLPVRELESRVTALAAGVDHTCALTEAGGVFCWGVNGAGQLGNGTDGFSSTLPVEVSGLSGITALAAGGFHTCTLTEAGSLLCWGANTRGQLGDGTTTRNPTPTHVSGLEGRVTALATGYWHTCVVTDHSSVHCWGDNEYGQLGDGTRGDGNLITLDASSMVPVQVNGLEHSVKAIAAGWYHTCVLTEDGGVWCWGANTRGQLGDGTEVSSTAPVQVSGLTSGVTAIAAGLSYMCALTEEGRVLCWGSNEQGQLGDGTKEHRSTPVPVRGLESRVTTLAAGGSSTCALTETGSLLCWGSNYWGQLGNGTEQDSPVPVEATLDGPSLVYLPLISR